MKNTQDFSFTCKQILRQIPSIPTNSTVQKHLDYLSSKLHNLPINNNVERLNIIVEELYKQLIESIYLNNLSLYMQFLIRILSINVKKQQPQPQQQNGQSNKYSIRDALWKKCNEVFFQNQNKTTTAKDGESKFVYEKLKMRESNFEITSFC